MLESLSNQIDSCLLPHRKRLQSPALSHINRPIIVTWHHVLDGRPSLEEGEAMSRAVYDPFGISLARIYSACFRVRECTHFFAPFTN